MFGDDEKKQSFLKSFILILLVIMFYYIYYLIFGGIKSLMESLVMSIATIPLDILVTGFIANYIVEKKDREKKENEMNMIIGIFYNQVGTEVLNILVKSDSCVEEIRQAASIKKDWGDEQYQLLYEEFNKYEYCVDMNKINLKELKKVLIKNAEFFIDLILNPTIQDKELFTETIVAMIHLKDELNDRFIGDELDDYEKVHITIDLNMAYKALALRWIDYMYHLQKLYPQLFTKALVTSPFDNREKFVKDKEFLEYNFNKN